MRTAGKANGPHPALAHFPVRDGEIHIGGIPLRRLALRVGRTPFYAYDRGLIAARVQALRAVLPAPIRLHYSVKANPMPALVTYLAALVDGLDVASSGELRLALDTGMQARHISFTGPGKSAGELEQAVAAGVVINIESERELATLSDICRRHGMSARVAVRVNPDFEVKTAGMKMGGGARQFGVDAAQVPALLAQLRAPAFEFVGLHIFAASQVLGGTLLAESLKQSYALACALADQAPQPLRSINLGGGFGIPYFPGEGALDLTPVARQLEEITADAAARFPDVQLHLELGRYLVGEAGVYVTRVIDKKHSRGRTFLVTDGGMNHHLAASGNLGQVIRRNYPVLLGGRMEQATLPEPVSVVGPLCSPLDMLADQVLLPEAEPGDLVVVLQSGAYGASASPGGFLSHSAVLEVLV
jgi:diaminopimelate decarboxylase